MIRYRVECNFGSRYFKDNEKALKYFNKCKEKHLDVELWSRIFFVRFWTRFRLRKS